MKTNMFQNLIKKTVDSTKKNSPAILTGLTIAGLFATGIAAYKAGLKADEILKAKKRDLADVAPYDKEAKRAVTKEMIKEMAPVVAPPIVMGLATAGCAIGSNTISSRRIAVLSAAYSLSEEAIKNLNGKMTELLGEKKTQAIKESIAKDKFNKNPEKSPEDKIIITGNGDVWCKDLYTEREFYSNAQAIKSAITELSTRVLGEMYVSLNDFYSILGLKPIRIGDDLGWNVNDLANGRLPISVTAILAENDIPCLCIDYDVRVRNDVLPWD